MVVLAHLRGARGRHGGRLRSGGGGSGAGAVAVALGRSEGAVKRWRGLALSGRPGRVTSAGFRPSTVEAGNRSDSPCFMNLSAEMYVKNVWGKITFTPNKWTEQDFLLGELFTGSNIKVCWTYRE